MSRIPQLLHDFLKLIASYGTLSLVLIEDDISVHDAFPVTTQRHLQHQSRFGLAVTHWSRSA